MATRKVIESDISGKANAATVTFALGGTVYEVDLTDDERKKLEGSLKTYIEAGRKASDATVTKQQEKKQVPDMSVEERENIRAWAVEQGYEIAGYGRIPKKILAAYDKAHDIKRGK